VRGSALVVALAGLLCYAPPALARWSPPARPAGCARALALDAAPLIVFPSSGPQARSGPGALIWAAPPRCHVADAGVEDVGGTAAAAHALGRIAAGAAAGASAEAVGASFDAGDLPGSGGPLSGGAGDLTAIMAAAGTAAGQVVVAGSAAATGVLAEGAAATGVLAEGRTVGAFATARPLGGPPAPIAASSSYLGDTVLASPVPQRRAGWAIAVRVQRHYSRAFAAPRVIPVGPGPVSAVAATMDYRADILLVWAARGGVYARAIARSSRIEPAHRLGNAAADPEIQALISDDGHAIVAWSSRAAAPNGVLRTTIALSISGADLAFKQPRVLERFTDLRGYTLPAGSLRLVRLSSEAVMIAWTGIDGGRYVVRASPVSLRRGAWAPVVVSGSTALPHGTAGTAARITDAVLAALVPGPDAEALALWSAAPRRSSGAPNLQRRAIFAARGHYAGPGEVSFEAPEGLAPPGPNGPPAVAFDPGSGRALAAWAALGAGGTRIVYALRAAGPASAALSPIGGVARNRPSPVLVLAGAALAVLALAAGRHGLFSLLHLPHRVRAHRG
jgi:hypothetical protein